MQSAFGKRLQSVSVNYTVSGLSMLSANEQRFWNCNKRRRLKTAHWAGTFSR